MGDSPRFPVRFDEEAFSEDLHHATQAGRVIAERERVRLERNGIRPRELQPCAAEGPEGTRLAGCVKTYLPPPDGQWGMVLTGDREPNGAPVLTYLAFGVRHPQRAWQPSVYQVAHRPLHLGDDPARLDVGRPEPTAYDATGLPLAVRPRKHSHPGVGA